MNAVLIPSTTQTVKLFQPILLVLCALFIVRRRYIGVPASAVLKCQGAEDNVYFWDYYKQDPLLYDEATKVEGHCFTIPVPCDNMLQVQQTQRANQCGRQRSASISSDACTSDARWRLASLASTTAASARW